MKRIEDIDKNLKADVADDGYIYHNVLEKEFSIHGLIRENDAWVRMPDAVARRVNEGVFGLYKNTAGGRVRFRTDASKIAIKVCVPKSWKMPHMPLTGQLGFDMYVGEGRDPRYVKTFVPPVTTETEYGGEAVIDAGMKTVTLNFPLYHDVNDLFIGVPEGAIIERCADYSVKAPIVYYGSSITQGGCASRPGNAYQAHVTRHFDADHINLGFSGSARAEDAMAEYIAGLEMSVFVYDYDHNAPTNEHLRDTHERFLRIIRKKQPTLPIVIMTRPKLNLLKFERERLEIVKATYEKLRAEGDENVYFIPGTELCEICGDHGTVDGCHPTDLGFYSMAMRVIKELEKILK